MENSQSEVIPSKLAHLHIEKIRRNPHNPRALFDPEPLQILRESIRELGILVTLLVYESTKTKDYVIIDSERRWRFPRRGSDPCWGSCSTTGSDALCV